MSKNNGGPVFLREPYSESNITLRDYFAAKALPAICSDHCASFKKDRWNEWMNFVAENSYEMADAMIKARGE